MDKPWYRHFWVWFVLAPLIGTLLASALTVYVAGSEPALVVDEFGPLAMAIERDERRDRRATELGIHAQLSLGARRADGSQRIGVHLDGADPARLDLALIHPTLQKLDRTVTLERDGSDWTGSVVRADTRLYVQLTDGAGEWRLTGTLDTGRDRLDLAPGR